MSGLDLSQWEKREIKSLPLTEEELQELYEKAGSYEQLFSKKSMQIKARGLEVKNLKEEDFKALLLDHYSFLKRPVFITKDAIFIGNDNKNLENLYEFFKESK